MRPFLLYAVILWSSFLSAQVYTVNTEDDGDDGVCDGIHCSLREAINASEADGVPSTILFNIPGKEQHAIIPGGPFPTITHADLRIIGESQPGGDGYIVIDFNARAFLGNRFWDILASNFYISGIEFTDYLFTSASDHIFQFGNSLKAANNSKIYNCSFTNDNSFNSTLDKRIISVYSTDSLVISNCNFGTDHTRSSINKLEGYIYLDGNPGPNGPGNMHIDSNVFVNKLKMIVFNGGRLSISNNIFGALDTSKNVNFLYPENAIIGLNQYGPVSIVDNLFIYFQESAVRIDTANSKLTITKNRFYENNKDIGISGGFQNDETFITDNFARNGRLFLDTRGINELDIERNNMSRYDTVFYNLNDPLNFKIRHIDNQMTCIRDEVIVMDPAMYPSHAIPSISTVSNNQINGKGNPNDSIVVYSNNRFGCPNAVCEAGIELGRTRADLNGNWILNAVYPNNTSISAYQFDSDPFLRPTLYSEFSDCYQCHGPVHINFSPTLCSGQTITYRSIKYTELNPDDSIFIKGNGVICDSNILVHVIFKSKYFNLKVPTCYPDTTHNDTLSYSVFPCDSVVILSRVQVGVKHLTKTYCDSSSIIIGSITFDKNNRSGIVVIPGAAETGCDSVIFVNLNFASIDTSVLEISTGLIARENATTYQWIDCDKPFSILTTNTNQIYTPTKNGNYAVIISKDGCVDTSSCFLFVMVGSNDEINFNNLQVFPNPAVDKIKIELNEIEPILILIYNPNGQKLSQQICNSKLIEFDLSTYMPGIYYIHFISEHGQLISKIVKN